MDTTPLPTQDCDESDSGLLSHYVIRITPYEKFSSQQLHEFIHDEPEITRYVIARETVPREHFHIVLSTELDITDVKLMMRTFLTPYWCDDAGKLPRGFGNKQYNAQLSDDINKAISYAVKEFEIVAYEGFSDEYINSRKAESFLKKKPSNFKSEYMELCETFQSTDMDIRTFMVKYINLKAKYGQQVTMHHAYGYAVSNSILRDDNAEEFVDNFLANR